MTARLGGADLAGLDVVVAVPRQLPRRCQPQPGGDHRQTGCRAPRCRRRFCQQVLCVMQDGASAPLFSSFFCVFRLPCRVCDPADNPPSPSRGRQQQSLLATETGRLAAAPVHDLWLAFTGA